MNTYLYNLDRCQLLITPHTNISSSLQEVNKVVSGLEIDPAKRSKTDLETIEKTKKAVETLKVNYLNNQSSSSKYIRQKLQEWKWNSLEKIFFKTEIRIEKIIKKINLLVSDDAKDHYLKKFNLDEENLTESVKIYKETTKILKKRYKNLSGSYDWQTYFFKRDMLPSPSNTHIHKIQAKALVGFLSKKLVSTPCSFDNDTMVFIYTSNDIESVKKFQKIAHSYHFDPHREPFNVTGQKCSAEVYRLVAEKHFPWAK